MSIDRWYHLSQFDVGLKMMTKMMTEKSPPLSISIPPFLSVLILCTTVKGLIIMMMDQLTDANSITYRNSDNKHLIIVGNKYNDARGGGVEDHRILVGSIISRLDNGAFVGLIYSLMVSLSSTWK